MGNDNSKYITELSSDSSESDSDYSLETRSYCTSLTSNSSPHSHSVLYEEPDLVDGSGMALDDYKNCTDTISKDLTTDAAVKSYHLPKMEALLPVDRVLQIEKELDVYEIVALVYLLYENAHHALQELMLLLKGAEKYPIYDWVKSEEVAGRDWQKMLIEALCIIKNYKVLRELGFQKQDLIADFMPHRVNTITSINKVRKTIYLILEKLDEKKTDLFLLHAKRLLEERNLTFDTYDSEYAELYFLKWETIKFVSPTDMSSIKKVLKTIDEEYLYNMLDNILQDPPKIKITEQTKHPAFSFQAKPSTGTDTHQHTFPPEDYRSPTSSPYGLQESVSQYSYQSPPLSFRQDNMRTGFDDTNRYKIDPENPGLAIIINQESFYTEIDSKYKHLLPEDIAINKLETRDGTHSDQRALEKIFQKFGLTVINESNLTHSNMVARIKEVVKSVKKESSLFVCILSHGDKGVVYGSNSCKVQVSEIQEIMCRTKNENLIDKPKILILQSCQGKQCQKITTDSDIEEEEETYIITTDGPKSGPRIVDILTFWATVPGYAAIRHKRQGSWFIQALCQNIEEYSKSHHFADICTRTVSSVTEKIWKVQEKDKNAMTPMVESTLRKDFYLPLMRDVQ